MANISRVFRNIGGRGAVETEASRTARAKAAQETADKERAAAKQRQTERQNQSEARATQRKGSIATKTTVSATDIREANTARGLDAMQRRIDDMDDGNRKKMMQDLLDRQRNEFEKGQAADVSRVERKSQQAARDRKMKDKVTLPEMPFKKGGMAKAKYAKGGMAKAKKTTVKK